MALNSYFSAPLRVTAASVFLAGSTLLAQAATPHAANAAKDASCKGKLETTTTEHVSLTLCSVEDGRVGAQKIKLGFPEMPDVTATVTCSKKGQPCDLLIDDHALIDAKNPALKPLVKNFILSQFTADATRIAKAFEQDKTADERAKEQAEKDKKNSTAAFAKKVGDAAANALDPFDLRDTAQEQNKDNPDKTQGSTDSAQNSLDTTILNQQADTQKANVAAKRKTDTPPSLTNQSIQIRWASEEKPFIVAINTAQPAKIETAKPQVAANPFARAVNAAANTAGPMVEFAAYEAMLKRANPHHTAVATAIGPTVIAAAMGPSVCRRRMHPGRRRSPAPSLRSRKPTRAISNSRWPSFRRGAARLRPVISNKSCGSSRRSAARMRPETSRSSWLSFRRGAARTKRATLRSSYIFFPCLRRWLRRPCRLYLRA